MINQSRQKTKSNLQKFKEEKSELESMVYRFNDNLITYHEQNNFELIVTRLIKISNIIEYNE